MTENQAEIKKGGIANAPNTCLECPSRSVCIASDFDSNEISRLEKIRLPNKRVFKEHVLFAIGDELNALFVIRSGQLKSVISDVAGTHKIVSFHMSGDVIGFDGLVDGRHRVTVMGLDDSDVCIFPIPLLDRLCESFPILQTRLRKSLAAEMTDGHHRLLMSDQSSEQRFADFILSLSTKWTQRGYSSKEFSLRMSRADLANYLGITIETLSRLIAKFRAAGLIDVAQRRITILNVFMLKEVAAGEVRRFFASRIRFCSANENAGMKPALDCS